MKALRRFGLVLFVGFLLYAQAPTNLSRIWLYYKLGGDAATAAARQGWVYMDDETMEVALVNGFPTLRIKPSLVCWHQERVYVGSVQASYPLLQRNVKVPIELYIDGLAKIEGRDFTVAADGLSLSLNSPPASPEVLIRYCSTQ